MKSVYRPASYFSPARIIAILFLLFEVSCSGSTSGSPPPAPVVAANATRADNRPTLQFTSVDPLATFHAPLLPPPGTMYFGAFVNFLKELGPYEEQTAEFEQKIGRRLAVHGEYYEWTDQFPNAQDVDDFNHGRVAVDSWDCGDTDFNVAHGKQDAVIKAHALAFKQYGHPIFLRWMWEMNLPYREEIRPQCVDPKRDINGYFSPTDYVAAWKHIRAVFAAQGVTNVTWVWCPSGSVTGNSNPMPYYPGANETDWAGFDHYDVTGKTGLKDVLAPYSVIAPLRKPIMIGETGSAAIGQVPYFANSPTLLKKSFPAILAFLYYEAYGHRQDWRLTSAGLKAYAKAGASAYLSGFSNGK